MSSSVGILIPNIWKVIKFHGSKPPNRLSCYSSTLGLFLVPPIPGWQDAQDARGARTLDVFEDLPLFSCFFYNHWIGLRENLQETMVFTIKYRAFL